MFRLLLRPKVEILELKWHFASYGLSNFIINIQVIELFSLSSFYRAKCSLSHVILQWKRRTPIPQISGNRACQVSFLSLTNTGVDQGFYFGGVGWGGVDYMIQSLIHYCLFFWDLLIYSCLINIKRFHHSHRAHIWCWVVHFVKEQNVIHYHLYTDLFHSNTESLN